MIKKEYTVPKKGMNRHTHPSEVSESEYTFGMNLNVQDSTGDGDLIIVNEPSNIKCLSLPAGYTVLKSKFDRVRERIYLFLVNEETNCSEIGYISAASGYDPNQVDEYICKCQTYANEEESLEDIIQDGTCNYTTVLSDFCPEGGVCTGCLNFSTKHPILSVVIRHSILGDEIYWNDGVNPDRYVKLYDIDSYFQEVDNCDGIVTPTCLQCDKLRVFNLFKRPCITPVTVSEGGALRAGVYAVYAVYSELDGTEVSDYFTGTNLISIFDKNNTILDQTQLDYRTNKAIQIDLKDLDLSYSYYKIVVAMSIGNDPGIVYKTYGIFPTDQELVTISQISNSTESNSADAESGNNVNQYDILNQRPSYLHSKLMTSANGYLFLGDLEAKPEWNLQPVVNLMGGAVKWGSAIAKEDLYEYGESTAKFKTYHRDEVVPLAIRFLTNDGYMTALFPLIARPPFPEEIEEMPNDINRQSIEDAVDSCGDYVRDRYWQFRNTAIDEGAIPCETTAEGIPIEVTEEHSCITETVFETEEGVLSLDTEGKSLQQWIEDNVDFILTSSDPELSEIKDALSDTSYYGDCVPEVGDNCEVVELEDSEIIIVSVEGEKLEDVSIPVEEYDSVPPPTICDRLVEPQEEDTDIEAIVGPGSTVYKKTTPTNTSCSTATLLMDFPGVATYGFHLQDMGTTSSSSNLYNTSIPVTLFDDDFKPFLHNNAIWMKVAFFSNSGKIIANLTNAVCGLTDDNTNNKVRITVFSGCPTLTEVPSYGVIINDISAATPSDLFIELDSADFSGQTLTAYIAVDSAMKSEMEVDLVFSGTSGDGVVDILGNSLGATFTTDLTTTASNFVTSNSAVLATLNIVATSSGNTVTLIMNELQYNSLTYTQTNVDLVVTPNLISQKHLLQPPCGCFTAYRRVPTLRTVISYDNIIFAKKQTYTFLCEYTQIPVKECNVAPRREGLFSYVESGLKYPCNKELYDSSELVIAIDKLPSSYKTEFEGYYVNSISGSNYVLSQEANFMDKGIRHYKFPDNSISPFMQLNSQSASQTKATNSYISPIGFRLDNDVINAFLDIAVDNNLITQEDRDSIVKYELFRGDRATERSVIAKGLLFNMRSHVDIGRSGGTSSTDLTYYPNYPLNDSSPYDIMNGIIKTSLTNEYFYTFHSPETHFEKPSLPNELLVDSYQVGVALNKFSQVRDHAQWVLLGKRARMVASSIAGAEVAFEITMKAFELMNLAQGGSGFTYGFSIVFGAMGMTMAFTMGWFSFGKYKYEWLQTFENFGNPFNFAYYGTSEGLYKNLIQNDVDDSFVRGLGISSYLRPGRRMVVDETGSGALQNTYWINNHVREDSVVLRFGEQFKLNTPVAYKQKLDNSIMRIPTSATGVLGEYLRSTKSPYGTLKRYLPNQYGSINSVSWLSTGYCGDLSKNNSCDIVFGGDIFISRFAVRRKFPFFTETAIGLPPNTPFKYSSYFNLNTGWKRSYIDYKTANSDMASGAFTIPENNSEYLLWNGTNDSSEVNEFYVKDDYKFMLYYYGFPYFLVESEINCNYQYAGIEKKEDFYPHFGDVIEHTQEVELSIKEPNLYKYNKVYSSRPFKTAYRLLPVDFTKEMSNAQNDLTNAIIASNKDNQESSKFRSPWLNYNAADFYRFKKTYGNLIDIKGIESEMLWARFVDGYEVLNTIDVLAERQTPQTRKTGLGGMFQQRAINFNVTDLGYGGTQHRETISTEFGHYWVDAKRGKVFELLPGAKGSSEISTSMSKWFKEQLPFKILKKFPNVNIDNPYNGLGIAMGWDDLTKRVFITKLDYIPIDDEVKWSKEDGFYISTYDEERKEIRVEVKVTDENYFKSVSWTVAYSPLLKIWISYYSFTPFYYISLNDHFKTGLNIIGDDRHGIWSHYPLQSSYQVYYGSLYPFIVEYALKNNGSMSTIDSIEYLLDVKKYYNKFDFSNVFGKGFNKAYIYNDKQNTGELLLKVHDKDDMSQQINYPKYYPTNTEVLSYQNNDFWALNHLYNNVRDDRNRLPIWLNDEVDVMKDINHSAMDFDGSGKDRLRGDYFLIRLIQDSESRNRMVFRFNINSRNYYE